MSLTDALTITGFVIGVVGLAYAIYQGTERRRLERFVRSQSWYTYAKANNVTGIIQYAFQVYKTKQLAEPRFDSASIQRWIADGKLDAAHAPLFVQLAIESYRSVRQMGTPNAAVTTYADRRQTSSRRVAG